MPFRSRLVLLAIGLGCTTSYLHSAQTVAVPRESRIDVQVERDTRMKVGREIRGRTLYPVYVDNRLVIPAGSEVIGKIVALDRAPKKRGLNAKLGGDFTPLHTPEVQFSQLVLSDGTEAPLQTLPSSEGVTVVRFQSLSAGQHTSFVKKLWADAVGRERETVRTFTAPGKADRAKRALYSELPYHPELLEAGAQFAVTIASAVSIPVAVEEPSKSEKIVDGTVKLSAALLDNISSTTAVPGTRVRAIVTEPMLNQAHEVQVPQGSMLIGEITQAHPAGKWGKGGTLRFSFRELQFPAGFTQKVHGAPVSVDADENTHLQLDTEGGVKQGRKGAAAPLAMGILAVSAVHEDEASVLHTAGASNGFALIGRALSFAVKSQYVGAAFGFYGTGRAVYSRYITHGENVSFPQGTRIEVALSPERANALAAPANR